MTLPLQAARRLGVTAALLLGPAWLSASAASTDISDTPMSVKNNVAPNFMFMLDNSGSMYNIVAQTPYDSSANYLLGRATDTAAPCTFVIPATARVWLRISGGIPYITTDASYNFGSGSNRWNCSTTTNCTLDASKTNTKPRVCFYNNQTYTPVQLNTVGRANCGTSASCDSTYTGHYLNWYFGGQSGAVLTGWSGRKPGTSSRIEVAQTALNGVIDSLPLPVAGGNPKVRVGLTAFEYDGSGNAVGGSLRFQTTDLSNSTVRNNLKSQVSALTPQHGTPLSETLADIGRYFTLGNTTNQLTLHPTSLNPAPSVAVSSIFNTSISNDSGSSLPANTCTGTACPVQYWCQRSYAILLTDGRSTQDQNISSYLCDYDGDSVGYGSTGASTRNCATSGNYDMKSSTTHPPTTHYGGAHVYEASSSGPSDYLNDIAQALYEMDLRPDVSAPSGRTKKNNVTTFTIGFSYGAGDPLGSDPLLWETAVQGGGDFLVATSTSELTTAFTNAINAALAKDTASAAVAVVNTQITIDNTAYASSYNSGYWTGDLEAFSLDTTTGIPILPSLWSAQAKLDAMTATSRRIVTFSGSAGIPFQATNLSSAGLLGQLATPGISPSDASSVVAYLRGDRTNEGGTYRRRSHLLGDIINAEPVVVKYGTQPIVFQAGNDGMLHVFNGSVSGSDATRGQELWAYVPKLALSPPNPTVTTSPLNALSDPTYAHRFFVDATPTVADVPISGNTTKVLIAGLGKGGRGYYAINVADPTGAASGTQPAPESYFAQQVMWEFPGSGTGTTDLRNVGYTYGKPLIVNTPNDGWVVLAASGYNNGTDTNGDGVGRMYVLNPATGAVIRSVPTGAGSATNPSGLAHLTPLTPTNAGDPVKFVYGGDLLGNVWRFDLTNWTATKIATTYDASNNAQPISTAPAVGPVSGSTTKAYVYVGTGLYLGDSDVPGNTPQNAFATQTQSMYGFIDDTSVASPALPDNRGSNGSACPSGGGNGDLVCQTIASTQTVNGQPQYTFTAYTVNTAAKRGWYFDLPTANSRVVTHPQLTSGGTLAFTVNIPTNVTCDPGGSSWFYAVDASNGGAILQAYGGSTYYATVTFLDYALASRPVIVQAAAGKRGVIRMSNRTFQAPPIPEPPAPTSSSPGWRRIYWRELM